MTRYTAEYNKSSQMWAIMADGVEFVSSTDHACIEFTLVALRQAQKTAEKPHITQFVDYEKLPEYVLGMPYRVLKPNDFVWREVNLRCCFGDQITLETDFTIVTRLNIGETFTGYYLPSEQAAIAVDYHPDYANKTNAILHYVADMGKKMRAASLIGLFPKLLNQGWKPTT